MTGNILVTGGTGFLGRGVVQEFQKLGMGSQVYSVGSASDVRRAERWLVPMIEEYDIRTVIHLAAHVEIKLEAGPDGWPKPGRADVGKLYETNVVGTAKVVDACVRTGVKHLVFASSQTVYGFVDGKVYEGAPMWPLEHYAASKAAAEMALWPAPYSGTATTILRIPGIYAECRKSGAIWTMCRDAVRDNVVRVNPDIRLPFCAIHRDDVARAIGMVVEERVAGTYNVAPTEAQSLTLLGKNIAQLARGVEIEISGPPQPVVRMDGTKIEGAVGFKARPTEDRLRAMIESIGDED